jgi:benzodiazapine receptor
MDATRAHALSFAILLVVATVPSGVMKATKSPWYDCIKPSITPPNIVFPIAWSILYTLIALVLAQTLQLPDGADNKNKKRELLWFFGANLVLNTAWTLVYFGMKQVTAAFAVLVGVVLTLLPIRFTLWSSESMPGWTFWALVPYLAWLLFAGVLNGLSIGKAGECVQYLAS